MPHVTVFQLDCAEYADLLSEDENGHKTSAFLLNEQCQSVAGFISCFETSI